jgi:hypothetical protein
MGSWARSKRVWTRIVTCLSRVSPRRVVLRYEFEFRQQGRVVYLGDQSAMFVKDLR